MEQEIKNTIGLGIPELVIESEPKPEPEPKPIVTIYDFSALLSKYEPPKKQRQKMSVPSQRAVLNTVHPHGN